MSFPVYPAPPLTLENVLEAVKKVKSWRELGDGLFGYLSLKRKNDIERQHGSDEACLKAVVDAFLLGEGNYKAPSWRMVMHALHGANESHLADQIKSYAEPVQGECVSV